MNLLGVCAGVFVLLLSTGLSAAVLLPRAHRTRAARKARLAELARYRLLAAVQSDPTGEEEPEHGSVVRERAVTLAAPVLRARGNRAELVLRLDRAGLRMQPEEWVAIQAGAIVGSMLVAVLAAHTGFAAPLGVLIGWLGPRGYLRWKTARRRTAFETGLPDALSLLASALRSGFAVNQSVGAVVREGLEPVAGEFARALHEVRLGAELTDALDGVAARMESRDLELVVMAMRTAREVGGNLAEILQTTVGTMRERVELRGEVKVLSAEGRLSAKVLTGLPIAMALYMFAFKRDYLQPMYTTGAGVAMSAVAVVLLVVGAGWLNKLTKIEV